MDDTVNYITNFLTLDNVQLENIAQEEMDRNDIQPSIGPEVGKLLGLLIRLTRAQRVLELGTCLGYSTVWLAQALQTTGGKLISVEYNDALYEETRSNLSLAGLEDVVELIRGDARTVIEQVQGPFDMIVQDSDKSLYPLLLERSVQLTRKFGIIVADDALFKPRGIPAKFSDPVHQYNQLVFADARLYSTILPIGDGITISVKLSD